MIFVAATGCPLFVALKLQQVSNMFETPAILGQQITIKIAPGLHVRFWSCNLNVTKIALSCRDKNRLCKQAFTRKPTSWRSKCESKTLNVTSDPTLVTSRVMCSVRCSRETWVSKQSHMSNHRLAMRTWSCANESCSMVNTQTLNVYDEDLLQSSESECDSWLAVVSPREGLLGWNKPEYLKTMAKIVFLLTSWRGFVKRTKRRKCVERWDRNDLSLGIEIIIKKRLFSLKI